MSDAIERTASWLDEATLKTTEPTEGGDWARVEIFGHRIHHGRISEVEKFGTKMLRIDVPVASEAGKFESFVYGGASIFSLTPMTEEAARKWLAHYRGDDVRPVERLPAPSYDYEEEEA